MHKLYFTRHGETVWNVENKICGMTDSPLTERGRAQARALGQKVKSGGYAIDEILYSPLSRAADTAKAILLSILVILSILFLIPFYKRVFTAWIFKLFFIYYVVFTFYIFLNSFISKTTTNSTIVAL